MSTSHLHRLTALDALTRRPGRPDDRTNCEALQRAIELLAANVDEGRAAIVLLAIVSTPTLAEAICATAYGAFPCPATDCTMQDARPEIARRFAGRAPEPSEGRRLIDLHIELERAWVALGSANEIRDPRRWAAEMDATRENIARLEAEIEQQARKLA